MRIRLSSPLLLVLLAGCATSGRQSAAEDPSEHLQREINKVQFAIQKTEVLIARAQEAEYLPDLYMRLAGLYTEEARYRYHKAGGHRRQAGSVGVAFLPVRVLKNRAIGTYRRLLVQFPDYPGADRVRFFMAHELRELGKFDEMLGAYRALAEKHPDSRYRLEGLLIMGDYHFDRARLQEAEKSYQQVLASPETRVHALARYKLAWCKINRGEFAGALRLLEKSVAGARKWLARYGGKRGGGQDPIDLRKEALVDAVFPFTEVHKPGAALRYFKGRADSKQTYLAALTKLGQRYHIKQNWSATAMVYREVLALSGDSEDAVEFAARLYEAVTSSKQVERGDQDVATVVAVIRRRVHDHKISKAARASLIKTFEKYARDIATRLHDRATQKKEERLYHAAVRAYLSYLSFFRDSESADKVRANLAGALFAGRRYLEAGINYELVSMNQKGAEQQRSIWSAAAAFYEFLKGKKKSKLAAVRARAGLRRAGRRYIELFPKDPRGVQIKFNIARTHYKAGEFDQAIRFYTALWQQYPTSKEAVDGAHMALDAYRILGDELGLIMAGKQILAEESLGDRAFKTEIGLILEGAKNRLLGKGLISGTLKDLEGTDMECRAIAAEFAVARRPLKRTEIGRRLRTRCQGSPKLGAALEVMGKDASQAHMFVRAASLFEEAARRQAAGSAAGAYEVACVLRVALGHREAAERALGSLLHIRGSKSAARARLATQVARLHLDAGDWSAAAGVLQRATAAGLSSPDIHTALGYALLRGGAPEQARAPLLQAKTAAARYYLGELSIRAFLASPEITQVQQIGPILTRRLTLAARARKAFGAVVGTRDAVWSVAALGRLAAADVIMARALEDLTLPGGLSPDQVKQIRSGIAPHAASLKAEARSMIKQCAAVASKHRVLSAAARACLSGAGATADPWPRSPVAAATPALPGAAPHQKALAKNPGDLRAVIKLGRLTLGAGQPRRAQLTLEQGAVKETAPLLNLRAVAHARQGRPQQALLLLGKALDLDPGLAVARRNVARLLARYGHHRASRDELKKVRGRSPAAGDVGLIR